MKWILPFGVLFLCLVVHRSNAQIPRMISYQGVLSDTTGVPRSDGTYAMTFRLYTSISGGSPIWIESRTLQVRRGLFSTTLGDVTPFADSVRFNRPYWLSLQIGSDPEHTPRMPLTSMAYSLSADTARVAGSMPDNAIAGSMIAGGQVVKSLNGLKDGITLRAQGGATITSSNDTITINSGPGGGGTGIQGIQNTNNTLDISNPGGPTATVNVKIPLSMTGLTGTPVLFVNNALAPGGGGGVVGVTANGDGVEGVSSTGPGVHGRGVDSYGVYGESALAAGVSGRSESNASGIEGASATGYGISGNSNSGYAGVYGVSSRNGVFGETSSQNDAGVYGRNNALGFGCSGTTYLGFAGVYGTGGHNGVFGETASSDDAGVYGRHNGTGYGVSGYSQSGFAGVFGTGAHNGVFGSTNGNDSGVHGRNDGSGPGISGFSVSGYAVRALGSGLADGSWVSGSDRRFKKDVEEISGSLDNVRKLRGVRFHWKVAEFPERHFPSNPQIGLVAQELQRYYPELVMTDEHGYEAVDYPKLTAVLLEAIKEQQTAIDSIRQRLAAVESLLKGAQWR